MMKLCQEYIRIRSFFLTNKKWLIVIILPKTNEKEEKST